MIQESQNQRRRDVGQFHRRRPCAQMLVGKRQEEYESIPISCHGSRTKRALFDEVMGKKFLNQRWKRD
jgi:hypothetical protein